MDPFVQFFALVLFWLFFVWIMGLIPLVLFYLIRAHQRKNGVLFGPFFPTYLFIGITALAVLSALTLIFTPLTNAWDTFMLTVAVLLPVVMWKSLRTWSFNLREELAAEQ